ncbi:DUF1433 domain-containing protein [Bacillus spizizenii]|uniref:DUF1433 domain-containing protein n=1 Tax=Bacillus TaxID=1386 RepID=UPI00031EEEA5|nr:DUF1433 domain-containing protein [Bacillus spizizenii]MCY9377073.1 DUF1433 domain-containing protein [Bacillus sp. T17B1]
MSFVKKILIIGSIVVTILLGISYEIVKKMNISDQTTEETGGKQVVKKEEKSDKEKAEEYVEKMKPKIKEHLKKEDIHNFIKTIAFEDKIEINPMGRIIVNGYINDNPDKFYFSADLIYDSNKVDGMSYSEDVGNRFTDWSEYSKEVKDKYIKTAYPDKKEREQYLKDIGELK